MIYAPPSYQAAAYRQLWSIIAPYIRSDDLFSTCLVCRQWHELFAPYLWGNPAVMFGPDYDTVYLSITRFKRLLARSRPEVRRLTHTLQIPPAEAEFYDGPQASWLRDILDRLPSLHSLIASRLSFFDHQALQAIDQCLGEPNPNPKTYPLRLLTAAACENTTATSLRLAIQHFPDLIYLDLSSTQGVRNQYVLQAISSLWDLKVLKLRRCGLRDEDVEFLTFSDRLLSLDLCENLITEKGLVKLLARIPQGNYGPPSPFARRYSRIPLPKKVLAEGIENYVFKTLTSRCYGYLDIEEGLPTSFSQLYLTGNQVCVESLAKYLDKFSLDHLDCGSLYLSQGRTELLSPTSESRRLSYPLPEKQRLSPAIFTHTFRTLRSLRIHHSLITSYPFSGTELPVSEQCFELHDEDLRFELDSVERRPPEVVFELDDTSIPNTPQPSSSNDSESHATFDSPDDVGTFLKPDSPITRRETTSQPRSQPSPPAPQLSISQLSLESNEKEVCKSAGISSERPIRYQNTYSPSPETPQRNLSHPPKPTTIKEVIEEAMQRRQRTAARERHPGRFKPSMLPNLKTLTLTDVPLKTRNRDIPDSLSLFIQECGEEEEISRLQELPQQNSNCVSQEWNLKQNQPVRLKTIALEMSSKPDPIEIFTPGSPRIKRNSFTKSSTEDPDSECFMEATERDFSFFAEDDGGLLISKGRIDAPVFSDDGLMLRSGEGNHLIDVISQLAGFRRLRKAQWDSRGRVEENRVDAVLLGYWRGEVKVVKEAVG